MSAITQHHCRQNRYEEVKQTLGRARKPRPQSSHVLCHRGKSMSRLRSRTHCQLPFSLSRGCKPLVSLQPCNPAAGVTPACSIAASRHPAVSPAPSSFDFSPVSCVPGLLTCPTQFFLALYTDPRRGRSSRSAWPQASRAGPAPLQLLAALQQEASPLLAARARASQLSTQGPWAQVVSSDSSNRPRASCDVRVAG